MNIFKTFEIFLREPLSVLTKRIIQIVNINSDLVTQASVDADLLDNKTQITVVNSDKMFNLLKKAQYKKDLQEKLLTSEIKQTQNNIVFGRLLLKAR